MTRNPSAPRPIASHFETARLDVSYETRFTAFLDILGWKALVCQSEHDSDLMARMAKIIEFSADMENHRKRVTPLTGDADYYARFSQFSDSIIISRPSTQFISMFILDVLNFQATALYLGFLVRGAITVGSLHHSDNVVFGPALVEAYRLESECAIYPRVIVDDKFLSFLKKKHNSGLGGFIKKDVDGLRFINFLKIQFERSYSYNYMSLDQIWGYFRELGVFYRGEPRVLAKIDWLCSYWNGLIDEYSPTGLQKLPLRSAEQISLLDRTT